MFSKPKLKIVLNFYLSSPSTLSMKQKSLSYTKAILLVNGNFSVWKRAGKNLSCSFHKKTVTCKQDLYHPTQTHTQRRIHTQIHARRHICTDTCTHTDIYTQTHAYARTQTHARRHIHAHTQTRTHMCAHTQTHARRHTDTHGDTQTHAYARAHTDTYTVTHGDTRAHTHGDTCTHTRCEWTHNCSECFIQGYLQQKPILSSSKPSSSMSSPQYALLLSLHTHKKMSKYRLTQRAFSY